MAPRPEADAATGICSRSASLQQFLGGAAIAHALADDHHRPLGAEQHVDRLDHAFRIGAAAAGDIAVPGLRVRRLLGGRFHEHVEGNIQHHRARTARGHGLPGLPDRERHHLAAGRLEHLLAIGRARWKESRPDNADTSSWNAPRLNWLVGTLPVTARNGTEFEKRIAERDRQVGRARPAGGEGRGRPPRNPVIDIRHEAGDALVMHRDGLELVGTLVQRVDELDIAVTAQAEHLRHFFLDQIVDDNLGPVERIARRHRISPYQFDFFQEIGGLACCRHCPGARHPISHNTVRQFILW